MTELNLSKRERLQKNMPLILLALVLALSILSVLLFQVGKGRIIKFAKDSYTSATEEAYQSTYDDYVHMGEDAFHTTNHAKIEVGPALETSDLEVLTVCATVLVHNSKKDIYEEITGYSHFSSDLKAAEYMIDDERQTVYIRLPEPKLMEPVTLDEDNLRVYNLESDGKISYAIQGLKGSIQNGEREAVAMRDEASAEILSLLKNDPAYMNEAKESAQSMISALVREINPTVDDLKVVIEFY